MIQITRSDRKSDESPVTIADKNTELKIRSLIENEYPDHGILGEEFDSVNPDAEFIWVIDPIDGTKEYIAGKDEYTLNAALVINTVPIIGLVGVPKKGRLFYSFSPGESYMIEREKTHKIYCKKQQPKGQIVALSSVIKPTDIILNKLKQFNVTSKLLLNFAFLNHDFGYSFMSDSFIFRDGW